MNIEATQNKDSLLIKNAVIVTANKNDIIKNGGIVFEGAKISEI